jgi:hypothetical protein
MKALLLAMLSAARLSLKSRRALALENLALRQPLAVVAEHQLPIAEEVAAWDLEPDDVAAIAGNGVRRSGRSAGAAVSEQPESLRFFGDAEGLVTRGVVVVAQPARSPVGSHTREG